MNAKEAIAYAKTFLELRNLESKTSRTILRLNASKAAIQSNKEFNEIKAEYIDWFYSKYSLGKDSSEIKFSGAAEEFGRPSGRSASGLKWELNPTDRVRVCCSP